MSDREDPTMSDTPDSTAPTPDAGCDRVEVVHPLDWRGCAWVAEIRALLAEGGE